MKARNYLARLRGPGKDMDSRLPPVIEVSSEEEAAETEIIWRTYASIVPALDYLAARGIIEPKPEGASWANTLIVLTEKGRTLREEAGDARKVR
jgi:hypothetical protein